MPNTCLDWQKTANNLPVKFPTLGGPDLLHIHRSFLSLYLSIYFFVSNLIVPSPLLFPLLHIVSLSHLSRCVCIYILSLCTSIFFLCVFILCFCVSISFLCVCVPVTLFFLYISLSLSFCSSLSIFLSFYIPFFVSAFFIFLS